MPFPQEPRADLPPFRIDVDADYPYFSLNIRMVSAIISVMMLATITGKDSIKMPYASQTQIPTEKIVNVPREMSLADLFL